MSSSSTERETPSSSAGIEKLWLRKPGPQVLWPGSRIPKPPKLDPRVPIHSFHGLAPSAHDLAPSRDLVDMVPGPCRRSCIRRWVPSNLCTHVGVRAIRERIQLGVASRVPLLGRVQLVNHRGCALVTTPRIVSTPRSGPIFDDVAYTDIFYSSLLAHCLDVTNRPSSPG